MIRNDLSTGARTILPDHTPLDRAFFDRPATEVAPDLLGRFVAAQTPDGQVVVRLTEVEAYAGEADPGSHAFRGRTNRTAVMFGPPGHAYVYFTYGMHYCVNLVCEPAGAAAAVLLRAGEVIEGRPVARRRRSTARPLITDRELARGPARLTVALGIDGSWDGTDVVSGSALRVLSGVPAPVERICSGPRVGVGGAGAGTPWRFWIDGDPTVSAYRAHVPRRRSSRSTR